MLIFTSLLLLHRISHHQNAYLWFRGGQRRIFTGNMGEGGRGDTKIFIEFILFLILKQINHRGRVWRFSYFPECQGSRCAHTLSPTLISGEKNCGTVVTTHFSAKGQKAWKQIQGKAETTGRACASRLHLLGKQAALRLTWVKRPWTEPESDWSFLPCGLPVSFGWNLFLVECFGVARGIICRESLIPSPHVTARHFIKPRPAGAGISSDTLCFLKRDVLLLHI